MTLASASRNTSVGQNLMATYGGRWFAGAPGPRLGLELLLVPLLDGGIGEVEIRGTRGVVFRRRLRMPRIVLPGVPDTFFELRDSAAWRLQFDKGELRQAAGPAPPSLTTRSFSATVTAACSS